MALKVKFNPLTGKFDLVDVADLSKVAPVVPTKVAAGTITDVVADSQMTFTKPVRILGTIKFHGTGVFK